MTYRIAHQTKLCRDCNEVKPLRAFTRDYPMCKQCRAAEQRKKSRDLRSILAAPSMQLPLAVHRGLAGVYE